MNIYWIVAFLYATFWTILILNENAKEGNTEKDALGLTIGWLLMCLFMPIVLILQIIGVCIELHNTYKDKVVIDE